MQRSLRLWLQTMGAMSMRGHLLADLLTGCSRRQAHNNRRATEMATRQSARFA